MRKASSYIICMVLFFPFFVSAQEKRDPDRITCLQNPANLFVGFWDGAELQQVDTTFLEVVYNLRYRRETSIGLYYEMLTVLQVGKAKQKYYSMIQQLNDDVQIDVRQQINKLPAMPGIGAQHKYTDEERYVQSIAGVDWLNSEIWIDWSSRRLSERTHDYLKFNLSIEYEEPLPKFDWQFTEKSDTLCGYPCFMATTWFRGREWIVWYTPEIPISTGPWKFNGLPGIVLRAEDRQQDFIWECQSISQKASPVVYYKVESILLSREKWRRYLRRIHDSPLEMMADNGNHIFKIKGVQVTQADNWKIPYNPIELE